MQKIPTPYHVGQDEVHFTSCSIHPSHQHLIQLSSEPLFIVSGKESFISTIQLMCHFFLCFVVSSATSRVNLVYTHQDKASNVVAHHSHEKEQLQCFKNILIKVYILLQRIALIISPIFTSVNTTIKLHSSRNNELCCFVFNKLQPSEYFSLVFNTATKPEEFTAVTKIYDEISQEPKNKVALISEVVVQGCKNCIVQEMYSRTTKCQKQYVQYEKPFSTNYKIQHHELIVNKQHKYIVDGIDYMRKKFTINIYKDSSRNYDVSNTIDWIDIKIYKANNCNNICKIAWTCHYNCEHHKKTKLSMNVGISDNLLVCICTTRTTERTPLYHKTENGSCCKVETLCRILKTTTKMFAMTWMLFLVRRWKNMTLNLQMLLILSLCIPIVSSSYQNNKYSTNIIKTKYGPLRGIVMHSNPIVEAFLGVPYASPPVGSLRYMPPVTPSTWKTTKLADNFSPVCPQALPKLQYGNDGLFEHPRGRLAHLRRLLPLLSNQSEDCLYLNLYVPRSGESVDPDGTSKATIVYIHGESYEWNSGNPYDGSLMAADGNVILVTVNFRLGILGFMKTGAKSSAQGNFGLMDLVAALHWLRENLSAFHGDPSRITLMGHGTGAALANILVVSPVASDLIRRVILLSGSALSPWAIQRDPLAIKQMVANQTTCKLDLLSDDLAPCLRTKSVSELLRITPSNPRFLPGYAPFVDGTVIINPRTTNVRLPTLPSGSAITSTTGIEFANFPASELLFGLTSYESYNDLSAQDLEFGFNETRRDRILRTYVRNVFHFHLKEIYSSLRNEYTDWEHPPRNPLGHRDTILELLSDGHTAAPLVRLGYLHSLQEGKSYFLHFRHQSDERDFPQRGGSVRGEDVPFTFGLPLSPLFPSNYSHDEKQISRILVQYLTNFAKTGMPNGLKSSNAMDKSDISHGSARNFHNSKNNHRYKRSNYKFSLRKDQISLFLNNRLLKSLYRSSLNNSEFNVESADIYQNNNDNDSWDDTINSMADEPDDNEAMRDSSGIVGREQFNDNDSNDSSDGNDRFDDVEKKAILKLENWEMYDSINQIYLEIGCSTVSRSHYRGHKLSMWLSLIPQLHSFDDAAYLPMRHHHFTDDKPEYFDGRLKEPPNITLPRLITIAKSTTKPHKTETNVVTFAQTVPTECPPNMTIMPPVAATYPQRNQMNTAESSKDIINQMSDSQYQNYSTAFNITIGVGCFLLLLNVIIFTAIYYQREKHANLNKQKEINAAEEATHVTLSSLDDRFEQQKILRDIETDTVRAKFNPNLQSVSGEASFNEYMCNDHTGTKKKCIIVDVCSSELSLKEYPYASPRGSTTGSMRRSITPETYKNLSRENLTSVPQAYSSQPSSMSDSSSNTVSTCQQMRQNATTTTGSQCTQSEQTCLPETQEIGTTVNEVDLEFNSMMLETTHTSRSVGFQGGILRQQTGSIIHGTTKKRVQIQEISV
ncbi:uncharacterized protein LOC135701305 isoform X2 [Ochlerotatus camptorhynchus]|uniref:uncharacterized protein LOC135701305 isoform X2 n=1 Tax=Ochlerotatus camptorhynchus TaxID=644619 RepID=UPI0031DFAFD4